MTHATSGLRAAFLSLLGLLACAWPGLPWADPVRQAVPLEEAKRAADPMWHALLHLQAGQPQIQDPGFLLAAGPGWTPLRELRATLDLLAADPAARCRFPARARWLQVPDEDAGGSRIRCAELQEFLARAPATRIALVFAAENVRQPASIMGHLFLKLEGQTAAGASVSHAVSFFTDADDLNLPRLLYESLVTGKPGYFTLSPYVEAEQQYLVREQRSLWIYSLRLSPAERELLLLHLHELRQTRLTYFFQGYNCATLLKHVLALSRPDLLKRRDPWTTPKDVLKHADAMGLIDEVETLAPPSWRIRELVDALPAADLARARREVLGDMPPAADAVPDAASFLGLKLQQAYAEALALQRPAARGAWSGRAAQRQEVLQSRYADYRIDLAPAKDPRVSPGDTQYGLGLEGGPQGWDLRLDLLPISHRRVDWQPAAAVETSLALLEFGLRQPLDRRGGPRLRRLGLYAMESLLPWDPLVGGLSGRFHMALDDEDPAVARPRLHGVLGGAIGLSARLHRDLDVYGLLGLDLLARGGVTVRPQQELGMVIRGAFRTKTLLTLTHHQGLSGTTPSTTVLRWLQSVQLGPQWTVDLEARRSLAGEATRTQSLLQLRRIF